MTEHEDAMEGGRVPTGNSDSLDDESTSSQDGLRTRLEHARKALLDLTGRNRLLNTPRRRSRAKAIEITDELSEEVFRILVRDSRRMSFLPLAEDEEQEDELEFDLFDDDVEFGQPDEEEESADGGVAQRHVDTKLQTELEDKKLQSKLLRMFYDARTAEEEQGVNILYLALGFLEWYESDSSDVARHAPLILIPCDLARHRAGGRIYLEARDEDVTTNLSLKERLSADFGIELPEVPDVEELSPREYFQAVGAAVSGRSRFQVHTDDMVLSFFSFSKFLMYRDLDPESWPDESGLEDHPLLTRLLEGGFEPVAPLWPDEDRIDEHLDPKEMVHVMDADSSQMHAIEEVKAGRSLVIQGPPGTGKSQTITNLIAAAVTQGKSVLFVAEKLAALEVVRHRMDLIGLGQVCLELHSRKANKKAVLEALGTALSADRPTSRVDATKLERLKAARAKLNEHADALHDPMEPAGLTPYQVLGEMVRQRDRGTPSPTFTIPASLEWDRQGFESRRSLARRLAEFATEFGPLAVHPWRGATVSQVLPTDVDRVRPQVEALDAATEELRANLEAIRTTLPCAPEDLQGARSWDGLGPLLRQAPELDRASLAASVWSTDFESISSLVKEGTTYTERRERVDAVFRAKAWDWDAEDTRHSLRRFGSSIFRLLRSGYRQAKEEFLQMASHPPKGVRAWIQSLDDLVEAQRQAEALRDGEQLGSQAFGDAWRSLGSDWKLLAAVVAWIRKLDEFTKTDAVREGLADTDDWRQLADRIDQLATQCDRVEGAFATLVATVKLDIDSAFGVAELSEVPIRELSRRASGWGADLGRLAEWGRIWRSIREARELGLDAFVDALHGPQASPASLADQFEYGYYELWIKEAMRRTPEIEMFDGRTHEQIVAEFRKLDQARIELARLEVAEAHYKSLPQGSGRAGELGTIRHEIKKKRRHMPIRKLLRQAGRAIQRIKPVFMMSPLSIAQYLAPGQIEFDLLLIDEASQVEPVDALGAVLRSNQIVVVGDEKQLPPTAFFSRLGDDDDEEEDQENVRDIESILGMCSARGLPDRMLSWHYRSRHQSLIAVSNREFYRNRLYVVPSPFKQSDELGLKFVHVEDGVFDRGGRRDNRIEARRVAEAAIRHARENPHETLGVGTFSKSQQDAILNELERLWRTEPDVREYFSPTGQEPFFVKNLENIQGDERDVIFISVGYAPDESGYFAMNFGPLNKDGGERRLNVLITRAKKRCVVFSALREGDIDLNRSKSFGVKVLKEFLGYAEAGAFTVGTPTGNEFDSVFEEQVAHAIQEHGFEVVPQVGLAGFRIDLGVVDPDRPGRYLLGIECDGATYHSSRSARDRDRLRQQVLEDRGWMIHRIWSTDWFRYRDEQLRKTLDAIERARAGRPLQVAEPEASDVHLGPIADAVDPSAVAKSCTDVQAEVDELGDDSNRVESDPPHEESHHQSTIPYETAQLPVPSESEIHETGEAELAKIVTRIVEVEGPVRDEVIARRVTTLWGLKRTGDRILTAVDFALDHAKRAGVVTLIDEDFYDLPGRNATAARDRSDAPSEVRRPENLPPSEIRFAILHAIELHVALETEEIVRQVARLLGFKRAASQIASVIETEIERLAGTEIVMRHGRWSHT